MASERKNPGANQQNRSRVKKRRRKRRLRLGIILVVLVACGVFAVLSLTTLFRVETFTVSGDLGAYTKEQIIDACGIASGTNLFSADTDGASARITAQLPYIRTATVRVRLPDQVAIAVTQSQSAAVIETNLGCFEIDDAHKLLVQTDAGRTGQVFCGVQLSGAQLGQTAQYTDPNAAGILSAIADGLRDAEMDDVQYVDVTDLYAVRIQMNDLLTIKLGSTADLQKKLRFARYVIDHKLDPTQRGTLDLSVNTDQAIFRPDYGSVGTIQRPAESDTGAGSS